MLETLRRHHVNRIVDALGAFGPGPQFERLGAVFLDHHLSVLLVHRGLDVRGNPVGRTIDSASEDGLTAAEYSARQDYFNADMEKPRGDVAHVLGLHPDAQEIYLLSTLKATGNKANELGAQLTALHERTVHVYDARRIAEVIVDDFLLNDAAIDNLSQHLPVLSRIRDEHAANFTFPNPDPRHVSRPEVEAEIDGRLLDSPVIAIWGLGGAGKSDAAAEFGRAKKDAYQLRIWLRRGQATSVQALRSVALRRGGDERNVATLLRTRPCLLVVDDAQSDLPLDELAGLCGTGSHVIVTRRQGLPSEFQIPLMDRTQAERLLNQDLREPCPQAVFTLIWATVRGHPLSLGLMNRLAANGVHWEDIEQDCQAVGELMDGDDRLVDRLLARLRQALARELAIFAWAESPACDLLLMRKIVLPAGVRKVVHHGLTTPDLPNVIRLHDVVFGCLERQEWLTAELTAEFDQALASHIDALMAENTVALASFATTMRPKLEAFAHAGKASPAILVALMEAWDPDQFDPTLVPEPVDTARTLLDRDSIVAPNEVRAVIEAIEGYYRHDSKVSRNEAIGRLRARLPAFDMLSSLADLSERQLVEIKHHRAKALKNLEEPNLAGPLFEEILASGVPMDEARLQLIRLYARDPTKADRVAQLAGEILTAASEPGKVATTVVLATVEMLPWGKPHWRTSFITSHSGTIEREISVAAEAGLDQSLASFASIGRHWITHDPVRFARVLALLPRRPFQSLARDRDRFIHGEIMRLEAQLTSPPNRQTQEQALGLFQAVEKPNGFQRQTHGQLLIEMGRYADALAVLETVSAADWTGWTDHWMSVALLENGKAEEALRRIDAALEAPDHRLRTSRSRFRVHRYEIRKRLGDVGAVEDLQQALLLADDAIEQARVEQLLASVEK